MSQSFHLPDRDVTPESALRDRRRLLKWLGLGGVAIGAGAGAWWWQFRGTDAEVLGHGQAQMPGADLYPAAANPTFKDIDRSLTVEATAARYCNFYEFSSGKQV